MSFGLFFIRDLVNKFQGTVSYEYEKKTNIFIVKLSKYQK
jgi:sensor histidine kinase regulating citrate/malate metabolism